MRKALAFRCFRRNHSPEIKEIAAYHKRSSASFWEQYKRVTLPEIFKVDLSEKLYETKQKLLAENKG